MQIKVQLARFGSETFLFVLFVANFRLKVGRVPELPPGQAGGFEDVVQRCFVGIPEAVFEAQLLAELVQDDMVRPRLALGLDRLVAREHVAVHLPVVGNVVVLEPGRRRQDDVG